MGLKHGDKLFTFYDNDKIQFDKRYSYFGNHFGTVEGFSKYINGYIFAVQAIYNDYISCEETRIDKLDTLIYPLCFNYRQVVELYIKYFYFKYALVGKDNKEIFIKNVSHKLNKAWIQTKPHLLPLLSKINSKIDITIFDEFINEMDEFDTDSFRMRYPIKKDLSPVHSESVKLDVVNLNERMIELFDLFKQLDNEIEYVLIDNECSIEFENKIKNKYIASKDEINSILDKLTTLSEQEKHNVLRKSFESVICLSEIQDSPEEREIENIIYELSSETAAMLALITHMGGFIVDGRCKLAANDSDRYKDILKVAEILLKECEDFISFEHKYPNSVMCYAILEKGHIITARWLSKGMELMEECIK